MAGYGTRGDVEPAVVLGVELQSRGHEVRMAVPPDLVAFAESNGMTALPFGADTAAWLDLYRKFNTSVFGSPWRIRDQQRWGREIQEITVRTWMPMSATLMSLAEGADAVIAGQTYQEIGANVAERHRLPLITLHHVPMRPNGQVVPIVPALASRAAVRVFDWLTWRLSKDVEDAQRRQLGLPKATSSSPRRIAAWGALELQAYDEVAFPGLAAEWAKWRHQRPFVGALTMELATDSDRDAAEWIAAGTPPIFFGFGSMPVESPSETVEVIAWVCARMGKRALICSGWSNFDGARRFEHVKVVDAVNYAAVFPMCRAAVHHGGSGTTAASLRAGLPTLILSVDGNQMIWGAQVNRRLEVGTHRRLSSTTRESLESDLRLIMAPEYAMRARALATRMSAAADSVTKATDLVEEFASSGRYGQP